MIRKGITNEPQGNTHYFYDYALQQMSTIAKISFIVDFVFLKNEKNTVTLFQIRLKF